MQDPEVTIEGFLDMQVCVPDSWSDEEVVNFANLENPAGTTNGWLIRTEDSFLLQGSHERVECESKKGYVHIMLDC